tara:strand:- start:32529 stop:33056 length:528 start_codon:yes stop_codon:yes gene_type:complete
MNKTILILLTFIFAFSCTSLSKNSVKKGALVLRGGVYNDKDWNDHLRFERISWYKELSLEFELLIAQVDESSPFYHWFSERELEFQKKYNKCYVMAAYNMNDDHIPQSVLKKQLEDLDFVSFPVVDFARHLKMHPNYESLNLQLYKTYGMCRKPISSKRFVIRLPGFMEVFPFEK